VPAASRPRSRLLAARPSASGSTLTGVNAPLLSFVVSFAVTALLRANIQARRAPPRRTDDAQDVTDWAQARAGTWQRRFPSLRCGKESGGGLRHRRAGSSRVGAPTASVRETRKPRPTPGWLVCATTDRTYPTSPGLSTVRLGRAFVRTRERSRGCGPRPSTAEQIRDTGTNVPVRS
jgi:hypothetical protein